ncbi:NifU family protein [Propionicicella superfundia]|uniref:NifU family protein n=1 Tax=Propionicicella superfundia TaxID=348582 RepID=UPI000403A7FF|nr:NifU family protein [Propionicicella superfundia]
MNTIRVASSPLPVHPEPVAADGRALLWHVPVAVPLPVGRVAAAPGALGELFADATLSDGLVARGLVWLWLSDGRSWRAEGAQVREALQAALVEPQRWGVVPAGAEVLSRVTDYVLAGTLGAYIASHGGRIEVSGVTDEVVEFAFEGACAQCPAADDTLHSRLESAVREHYPALTGVVERPSPRALRRLLPWPTLRRAG